MNYSSKFNLSSVLLKIFTLVSVYKISEIESVNPEETGPYFQGDLILAKSQYSGVQNVNYRWPNKTIIYQFDDNYPEDLQATFYQAIAHIANKTCLKFQSRNTESDFINVTSAYSSCFSFVGRQGGAQPLSLPKGCLLFGTFVHEILHAVGFHHEQSRSDRDNFVKILYENVQPGKEVQFRKYDDTQVSSFGVPYDYGSILHYSKTAFSKDSSKLDTIVPIADPKVKIGQRKQMSEKDIAKVNKMYNCS